MARARRRPRQRRACAAECHPTVAKWPLSRARREETFELQAIQLRKQLDEQRKRAGTLEAAAHASEQQAVRALRQLDAGREAAATKVRAAEATVEEAMQQHAGMLKEQRAAAAASYRALQKEMQGERIASSEAMLSLEAEITAYRRQLSRAQAAQRSSSRDASAARAEMEEEVQRLREGRVWSKVREEQALRERAVEERDRLCTEVERLMVEQQGRARERAAEKSELKYLRFRVRELEEKVGTYHARSNRKFFEVEPLAEQCEELRGELEAQRAETAKYKATAEPPMQNFFRNGSYALEVDLAGLEAITSCQVCPGQLSKLFIIFARFFHIKLPTFERKVSGKRDKDGSPTTVKRTLLRIPGVTHWKELPAIAGELHKFQVGDWLLRDADASYCYIADGANSMQQELMTHLLSRRNTATGKLESMAVSMDAITDKTAEGQAAKYKEAMEACADAWKEAADLGLIDDLPELFDGAAGDEAAGSSEASGEQLAASQLTQLLTTLGGARR